MAINAISPSAPPERDRSDIRPPQIGGIQLAVTLLIVLLPVVALTVVCTDLLDDSATAVNISLLVGFYLFTGMGITAGFHRLFTHRSFVAKPALRALLAIAGSMAFEGGVISWIATHRRHHAFADSPGDPHSPHEFGSATWSQVRGAVHAHVGWLFRADPTSTERYAPDLKADRLICRIDRAFPVWCLLSLGLPALFGWLLAGTAMGALTALVWGGLIRILLLQHMTWGVNSLCHMFGSRPFKTRGQDRATNLWPLAVLSFGDSWHNLHHSDPTCARHGVDRGQVDITAAFIRGCELAGLATKVQWPSSRRLAQRRLPEVRL